MPHLTQTALAVVLTMGAGVASATTLEITVTNDAAPGGFILTPMFVAFHDGAFDTYDVGEAASPGLELLAELGDTSGAASELAAVDPDAVSAVVAAADGTPPPIEVGETGAATIEVEDPAANRFMSFLSMLVPTNDTFVGNGDPRALEIFDEMGAFLGDQTVVITGAQVRDAGTEVDDPADGPAFAEGVDATLGTEEGDTVQTVTSLAEFDGLAAANGTTLSGDFDFSADPSAFAVATITVSAMGDVAPIPVPAAAPLLLLGLGALGLAARRRA